MQRIHLTDLAISNLPFAAAGARYEVHDASVPNLAVRVGTRTKTFILRRRTGGSRNCKRVSIGAFPSMRSVDARAKAADWDERAKRGGDPCADLKAAEAERELRQRSTFRAVMEDYINYIPTRDRNLNAIKDIAFLRRNFLNSETNTWIDTPICNVTDADVTSLIKQIKSRAPVQAFHALTQIRTFFRWAMDADIRRAIGLEKDPISSVTHKKLKLKIKDRTRVLEYEEVAAYLAACAALPYPYGPCLRMLIETAQRRGAVRRMRWSEINFARKMWVMVSKEAEHQVPLSDRMVDMLKTLRDTLPPEHGDYIFSTTGGQTAIDDFGSHKIPKAAKKEKLLSGGAPVRFEEHMLAVFQTLAPGRDLEDWVWHDTRRTVRTHLEPITRNKEVAEAAIGHGKKGIERVYNLYTYRSEIRRGFNAWSELLHKIEIGTCTLAEWEHDEFIPEEVDR